MRESDRAAGNPQAESEGARVVRLDGENDTAVRRRIRARPSLTLSMRIISIEVSATQCPSSVEESYEVLEVLGRGSVATVRRAVRRQDGREVALKMLFAADDGLSQIVKGEYDLMRRFDHPNILKVLDFFACGDTTVLAAELFHGRSLSAFLASSGQPLDEAIAHALFVKLLSSVDYLHRMRVVHRDIKPENVLVSEDLKDLKVIDFNTARQLDLGGSLTATGTQLYAAPEVLLGEAPAEPNDVWSVGVCLFFMLSRRLPQGRHRLAQWQSRRDVASEQVVLSGRRWERVSEPCKAVLLQSLQREKAWRPAAMILLRMEWCQRGPGGRGAATEAADGRDQRRPQTWEEHAWEEDTIADKSSFARQFSA